MALARIGELEAQVASLSRNSTNSSKPPSSDPPRFAREPHKGSGKKRGGQPGHQGHQRGLLPPEKVGRTVDVLPDKCEACHTRLQGRDKDPVRHQVVDIPPITPEVIEYRLHALTCGCGTTTRARLPAGVPRGAFGPRLSAMARAQEKGLAVGGGDQGRDGFRCRHEPQRPRRQGAARRSLRGCAHY